MTNDFNDVTRIEVTILCLVLNELHILEEIGQRAIGHVSKAIWRGTIVAAKEIRVSGKFVENKITSYR